MIRKLFRISTLSLIFSLLTIYSHSQTKPQKMNLKELKESLCMGDCKAKNKSKEMSCKLTSPELQKRKETVIAGLKKQIIQKKELKNGYAFQFSGSDNILDELTEFIKTERECCNFFTFTISISGDKTEAWLELTGEKGVKHFIMAELGL